MDRGCKQGILVGRVAGCQVCRALMASAQQCVPGEERGSLTSSKHGGRGTSRKGSRPTEI